MPKIDVHVLHMENGIELLGDIQSPHITVHHTQGIAGNTMQARIEAFQLGTEPYIGFADPDDEVDVRGYELCLDTLESDPSLGGVYTNSTIRTVGPNAFDRLHYLDHTWSKEYHMSRMNPVHQMAVWRRDIYEDIINQMVKDVQPFRHLLLSYSEQLIYTYIASKAPWKFINEDTYTWYKRQGGNHSNASIEITRIVRDHIKTVLTRS